MQLDFPFTLDESYVPPAHDQFVLLEVGDHLARVVYRSFYALTDDPFEIDPINDLGWMEVTRASMVAQACAEKIGLKRIPYRSAQRPD